MSTLTKVSIESPFPNVITLGLGYSQPQELVPNDLLKLLSSISNTLVLSELFDTVTGPNNQGEDPIYQFKGMICYLGAHYVAFFRTVESDLEYDPSLTYQPYQGNFSQNKWFLYDDITVKSLGDWSNVVKVCIDACIKPTVLFYQRVHPLVVQAKAESRKPIVSYDSLEISQIDLPILERLARTQSQQMKRCNDGIMPSGFSQREVLEQ